MLRSRWSLVFFALLALSVRAPGVLGAVPPADPDGLTRERLACGLEVWVKPVNRQADGQADGQPGGAGEVYLSLVVRAGAIDERDDERGAAFLAKQAAGVDRPGIDPGLVDRFRSGFNPEGPAFTPEGRSHSAVSHAIVEFRLVFEADDAGAWSGGLAHARSLVDGWSPSDEALNAARRITLERSAPSSPEGRARAAVARSLFRGHPIGDRPLLPDAGAIDAISDEAIRRFVGRTFTPASSVLIIVGDVDPGAILGEVRRAFDGVRGSEVKAAPAFDVSGLVGRVNNHVIEGYSGAELSLIAFTGRVEPAARGGVPALDRKLIDRVAVGLVGDRLRREIGAVEPDLLSVDAYSVGWLRGSFLAEVSVRAAPPGAVGAARAAGEALAGVRAGGFEAGEFQAARQRLLDGLRADAGAFERLGAQRQLASLVAAVMHGVDWTPPDQVLRHAERLLSTTTDRAIQARALELFGPDRFNVVLLAPEPIEGVDEALGRSLQRLAGGAPPARRPVAPLDELPIGDTPGAVEQIAHDPESDVWTAQLTNGVVVRARASEDPPGSRRFDAYGRALGEDHDAGVAGVTVRVALGDGLVGEDAGTLGRSRNAAAAWRYPTLPGADAPAVRAWMRDRGLTFAAFESEHRVVIEIQGPPGAARDALDLAAAFLNAPGVDARFLDRVRVEKPWTTPGLDRLSGLLLGERDPRVRPAPEPGRIDPAAANGWLRRLAAAPIEASVVGSFEPESIVSHAAQTLGSLTTRPMPARPGPGSEFAWSALPRDERSVEMTGDTGEYVLGVAFADMTDLASVRPMVVASRALNAELRARAKEHSNRGLDIDARAWLWLGEGIPDRVTLVVRVEGDRDAIDAAPRLVDDAIAALMDGRVADEAISRQIERAQRGVDEAWGQRSFWAARLSALSWNGLGVDAVSGLRAAYKGITPATVRETLARSMGAGVHKRVTVRPAGGTALE